MAPETRIIDYSEARPAPTNIKKSGYVGVARYLSFTSSKNLTDGEAKKLHNVGLVIGPLFWETTATRAGEGEAAGRADRAAAEKQAAALGYPKECPIVYAVDEDVPASRVLPYFHGIFGSNPKFLSGVYGDEMVCLGVLHHHPKAILVQTAAWSGGKLTGEAHLYQRVGHEAPPIPGGGYDEEVICRPVPMWGPHGVVTLYPGGHKAPTKKPTGGGADGGPTELAAGTVKAAKAAIPALKTLTDNLNGRQSPISPKNGERNLLEELENVLAPAGKQITRTLAIKE